MSSIIASCAKEKINEVGASEGFNAIEFSAVPELTKTALSGEGTDKTVTWVKDDEIKIFYDGGSVLSKAETSGETTTFKAVLPQQDEYYAVYPSSVAEYADGAYSVSVPAIQDGAFAKGNMSVAKLCDGVPSTFYNVTSFVKVVVEDPSYTKVTVKAVGGENIAGKMAVTLDADGAPVIGEVSDGASEITLNVTAPGTYYVAIVPDVQLTKGLLAQYYKGAEQSGAYFLDRDFTIARSRIASMGTLEERIGKFYVSVEGAGAKTGKDWANALDAAGFEALIRTRDTDQEAMRAHAAMLNGATIYFAGGEYVFSDKLTIGFNEDYDQYVSITFDGSYTDGVKNLENSTVFSGNDDHRIASIWRWTKAIFNDCTFAKSKGGASSEAALKLSYKDSYLIANNCTFRDNNNTSRAAGLAIANGYAELNNCTFENNSASCGAAFTVDNEGCGGAVVVKGGTIKGNSNTGTDAAGAICNFGGGPLTVEDVTFEDNTSVANGGAFQMIYASVATTFKNCKFGTAGHGNSAKHGGAVAIKAAGSTTTFTECSFTDNQIVGDGGAVLANGSAAVTFKGCVFEGNKGSNGGCFDVESSAVVTIEKSGEIVSVIRNNTGSNGGAINILSGGSVTLNDCTVSGNTASTKGGAVYVNGGSSKIYSNNTTFSANVASGKEGGAITAWSSGKVYVNGGTFSENKSKWGPAIELESSARAEVSGNVVFTKNVASGPGGAMFVSGSTAIVSGASFIENSAATFGGAILTKNGTLEATECIFKGNYSNGSSASNYGGAISLGDRTSSGTNGKITAKLNKCFFTGNHAYDGGAICMNDTGANIYMNACSFYKDYCTESAGGATMYYNYGTSFHMNNCTVLDGTWNANGSNSVNEAWFYFNRACKFTISNCTFIGDLRKTDGGAAQTAGGLLRFKNGNNTGYSINNIIAPKKDGTYAAHIANTFSCTSYYTKRASLSGGSNWNSNSTDGYNALASAFGGLTENANANGTYADNYYSWNGTMSGIPSGSQNNKAQLSDVNAQIQTSDADFYTWLNTIGALDKDQLGNARGAETWPGAYDGSNN